MNIPTLSPKAAAYLSATAWTFNFTCQLYGMLSSPNMKDIADAHHSFLSPQPFAIAFFFFPQTCVQVYWIYRLFKSLKSPFSDGILDEESEGLNSQGGNGAGLDAAAIDSDEELDEAVKYAPTFALGNFAIGLWMVSWNSEHLAIALLFVLINSGSQLYYSEMKLPGLNKANALTTIVVKMFAGIGILDVFDNTASAFFNYSDNGFHPGIVSYILTLVASVGLPMLFDPILGACIVYDFVGLFFGQLTQGWWTLVLFISCLTSAAVVFYKLAKDREVYRDVFLGGSNSL